MTDRRVLTAADVDTETDAHFERVMSKVERARHEEAVARIKRIVVEEQAKERAMLMRLAMLPTGRPT